MHDSTHYYVIAKIQQLAFLAPPQNAGEVMSSMPQDAFLMIASDS